VKKKTKMSNEDHIRKLMVQRLKKWKADPVSFVRDVFKVEPDVWQADVLRAFPVHNRLAMQASKGVGKSTILAWTAWNFLLTRPYPKIAATSISYDNLQDGLWSEMAKWHQKSDLLKQTFTWTKTRIFKTTHPEN
jgi:hypothetical protein